MKQFRLLALIALVFSFSLLTGCGVINDGDFGVRTDMTGHIQDKVETGFYTSFTGHVDKYTSRESAVVLNDYKVSGSDKLEMTLDVAVYYELADLNKAPNFARHRSGQSACLQGESSCRLGYFTVENEAKSAAVAVLSGIESLDAHKQTVKIGGDIAKRVTNAVEASNPGVFRITRVVVSDVRTDPAVQDSVRKLIAAQKEVETAAERVKVMNEQAQANQKLASTLTKDFIAHEYVAAIAKCAENPKCTLIVDGTKGGALLNVKGD